MLNVPLPLLLVVFLFLRCVRRRVFVLGGSGGGCCLPAFRRVLRAWPPEEGILRSTRLLARCSRCTIQWYEVHDGAGPVYIVLVVVPAECSEFVSPVLQYCVVSELLYYQVDSLGKCAVRCWIPRCVASCKGFRRCGGCSGGSY